MATFGEAIKATSNPELPSNQPANQPFPDSDQWLANSLNELHNRDQEYLRLQSEESRQQYDDVAKANLAHQREVAQQLKDKVTLGQAQTQALDDRHDESLIKQAMEVMASLPTDRPHTENTLPLEKLRNVAQVQQRIDEAVERRGGQQPNAQPARPETFPDGSYSHIQENPDGTVLVELPTGERYKGDWKTVAELQAKSLVYTKQWAQQQRDAAQPQPGNGSANPNGAVSFTADGTPQIDFSKIPDVTKWQLDSMAQSLGYTDGQELVADQLAVRQRTERLEQELRDYRSQQEDWAIASSFLGNHPEFPATPEANAVLTQIIDSRGLDYSLDNLEMAHALALQQGSYRALSPAEQAIASGATPKYNQNRPVPPPMGPRGNPDLTSTSSPYEMNMQQLRQEAIRQQLESRG